MFYKADCAGKPSLTRTRLEDSFLSSQWAAPRNPSVCRFQASVSSTIWQSKMSRPPTMVASQCRQWMQRARSSRHACLLSLPHRHQSLVLKASRKLHSFLGVQAWAYAWSGGTRNESGGCPQHAWKISTVYFRSTSVGVLRGTRSKFRCVFVGVSGSPRSEFSEVRNLFPWCFERLFNVFPWMPPACFGAIINIVLGRASRGRHQISAVAATYLRGCTSQFSEQ